MQCPEDSRDPVGLGIDGLNLFSVQRHQDILDPNRQEDAALTEVPVDRGLDRLRAEHAGPGGGGGGNLVGGFRIPDPRAYVEHGAPAPLIRIPRLRRLDRGLADRNYDNPPGTAGTIPSPNWAGR